MPNLLKLPTWNKHGDLHVVVETPRGARAKFKFEPKLKTFRLSRSLMAGLSYPYDWGFIPSTAAEDGDPIDAMVIHDAVTMPGVVIRCRPVAVLEIEQTEDKQTTRNDRIMVVPTLSAQAGQIAGLDDLGEELRCELEQFFIACVRLEKKKIDIIGWRGKGTATRLIKKHAS